jgi:hypothetical protein
LTLLLDEMYPRLISMELRRRGHDASSVHDTRGGCTPDDAVFAHARAEGRAIVTENNLQPDDNPANSTLRARSDNHHPRPHKAMGLA